MTSPLWPRGLNGQESEYRPRRDHLIVRALAGAGIRKAALGYETLVADEGYHPRLRLGAEPLTAAKRWLDDVGTTLRQATDRACSQGPDGPASNGLLSPGKRWRLPWRGGGEPYSSQPDRGRSNSPVASRRRPVLASAHSKHRLPSTYTPACSGAALASCRRTPPACTSRAPSAPPSSACSDQLHHVSVGPWALARECQPFGRTSHCRANPAASPRRTRATSSAHSTTCVVRRHWQWSRTPGARIAPADIGAAASWRPAAGAEVFPTRSGPRQSSSRSWRSRFRAQQTMFSVHICCGCPVSMRRMTLAALAMSLHANARRRALTPTGTGPDSLKFMSVKAKSRSSCDKEPGVNGVRCVRSP